MWLKRNIVMLPTEGKANIIGNGKQLTYSHGCIASELEIVKLQGYHLYLTSDEKIKEGEWRVLSFKNWDEVIETIVTNTQFVGGNYCTVSEQKIIAATDTSLGLLEVGKAGYSVDEFHSIFPLFSQQFIEKWIKEYNKSNVITEVMVEYETKNISDDEGFFNVKDILKINSNNTINVKSIKDSWSREELHDLLAKHEYDKGVIDWKNFIPELCNEIGYPIVEEWFETNE